MTRTLVSACVCTAVGLVACGLDINGRANLEVPGDDAGTMIDASQDASSRADGAVADDGATTDGLTRADVTPGQCSPVGTPSCFVLPNGWTPVAYSPSETSPCPAPFTTLSTDVEEGPTPNNACQCDRCTITSAPSCLAGSFDTAYDDDSFHLCLIPGASLASSPNGSCTQAQLTVHQDVRIRPLPPSGGACTSALSKHKEAFTFAAKGRECTTDPMSAGCKNGVCAAPAVTSPYAVCIAAAGVQPACPAGPFQVRHVVGTDVSFDCSGSCACSVSAECASATLSLYQDSNCMGSNPLVLAADNGCDATNAGGNNYNAYKYRATLSNVACATPPPAPASNVQLVSPTTVCCAQ